MVRALCFASIDLGTGNQKLSDFDAARNELDEAFFDSILAGWWRKITKDKSFLASQNGQLLFLYPLMTKFAENTAMSIHKKEVKKVKKVTTHQLRAMKDRNEKIAMLTAYDFSMTRILDAAGIDILLVGDSASNVMAGHETTLPITLEQMIYHASSVVRAVDRALVVVDLPFGTYQGNSLKALNSAIRIMKESGAHAVKLEGGREVADAIERIQKAGVPVMGHLGLIPQSIYKFGTYTVRAKEEAEATRLLEDAKLLEELGCFAIVLEKIPAKLAKQVSESVGIPIIGIGAGPHVDGQVLVVHDMLGITYEFKPRFLRQYLNLYEEIKGAVTNYIADVKSEDFPNDKEQY